MPIYEYLCQKCGEFEVTQRITDEPLRRCPTCRGRIKKLISNTSFQLKGSGWYVTDYARKAAGKPQDGEGAKDTSAKDTKDGTEAAAAKESKASQDDAATGAPAATTAKGGGKPDKEKGKARAA